MKRTISITVGTLVVFCAYVVYSRTTVRASSGLNLVVLCSSCTSGNVDSHGPVGSVVLDQNTGKVWQFVGDSLFGQGKPIPLGKMTEVGKQLEPVQQ